MGIKNIYEKIVFMKLIVYVFIVVVFKWEDILEMYCGFNLFMCSFNFDDNKVVYIVLIYYVYIWMYFCRKGFNW